jgi:hypothetical protein
LIVNRTVDYRDSSALKFSPYQTSHCHAARSRICTVAFTSLQMTANVSKPIWNQTPVYGVPIKSSSRTSCSNPGDTRDTRHDHTRTRSRQLVKRTGANARHRRLDDRIVPPPGSVAHHPWDRCQSNHPSAPLHNDAPRTAKLM